MGLRIRQIVFAARDLESTVAQFERALGSAVMYRDPEVAAFGLHNAMLAVGDQFVEIVAPTREDAAAGRHLARHGDSAYMLILQTDDLARDRERLQALGVRIVWQSSHPDMQAVQLHPKDVGAAIVSLDQAVPAASWRWAGPDWQPGAADASARIAEVTIAAREPAVLARRWAEVLGTSVPVERDGVWQIGLAEGALRFVESRPGEGDRILAYAIASTAVRAGATVCGTQFSWRAS